MDAIALQQLRDEHGRTLTQIDDVLNTATMNGRSDLTDTERREHNTLVARSDMLREMIGRGMSARPGDVPMQNAIRSGSRAVAWGLDALLWTTAEDVAAGSYSANGEKFLGSGARNPVEQVSVRSETFGTTVVAPRIDDLAPDQHRAVRSFQQLVADMAIWGLIVDKSARSSAEGFTAARSHQLWRERWGTAMRAMDVDTSAEGGTWVPTGIGASMHEKVRASGKVAPLFARIDLPTNPWKWPIEGADITAYRVAEPTGDTETKMTASTPGTVAATFDAEIFGARTLFSRSMEADSAVAILPFLESKFVRAFVDAEEGAILDGDSDGTHQDSDVGASTTDTRTAWDGLRKKAIAVASTNGAAALSSSMLATVRSTMGKWGLNPSDLAIICGVSSYYDMLVDANLLTVDKYGPNAVLLNGQLGSVLGVPVIVSEHIRENLNASGVYDGITTTKTYALVVNRLEWAMGQRMALDIEADDSLYRETFQRVMVSFVREDFAAISSASTDDIAAIAINVTP